MALLDLFEHVVGDRLQLGGAVLDGKALDVAEHDLPRVDFLLEEGFEDADGLVGDGGPDAVAAEGADDDGLDRGVVSGGPGGLQALHAFELGLDEGPEVVLGRLDDSGVVLVCQLGFLSRAFRARPECAWLAGARNGVVSVMPGPRASGDALILARMEARRADYRRAHARGQCAGGVRLVWRASWDD